MGVNFDGSYMTDDPKQRGSRVRMMLFSRTAADGRRLFAAQHESDDPVKDWEIVCKKLGVA